MSFTPSVSLIIVSRKRQASLRRTISSLRFQTYQNFEVIVVSDAPDNAGFGDLPFADAILHLTCDEPNISVARNMGIDAARGDIIAFCDDDAVPDPCWLKRLVEPFSNTAIASAGGFVRGRNGINYQWQGLHSDRQGDDHPYDLPMQKGYHIVSADGDRFAKLQGTNCAFRAVALRKVGGFDEGYRFFLDETDVCLRLAQAGFESAFVPLAQVHHGFAESEQRSDSRAPKTLLDIGISKNRFLKKHSTQADAERSVANFVKDQKDRLIRLMIDGRIEPRDVKRLTANLLDGLQMPVTDVTKRPSDTLAREFTPFGHTPIPSAEVLGGSTLSRQKLMIRAVKNADTHLPTLVLMFSITTLFHTRDYDVRGFWVQKGGLFGRSRRSDPLFQQSSLTGRIRLEFERANSIFPEAKLWIVKIFRNFVLEKTKSDGSD